MIISIKGRDKAAILMALYNNATPDVTRINTSHDTMTYDDAKTIIEAFLSHQQPLRFTVILGRKLDINISGDTVDLSFYDAQNGNGRFVGYAYLVREGVIGEKVEC